MTIVRMRASELTAAERADLEAALQDPARFHSDGKEVGIAAIVLPLLLIPLEVVLLNEVRGSYRLYADPEVPARYFLDLFRLALEADHQQGQEAFPEPDRTVITIFAGVQFE